MKTGQELTCEVMGLGKDLEGVCRVDGQVLFVPFALPGERVRVRVERVRKNHATGQLFELLSPVSPERQPAPCPVFTQCGGCQAQHMAYDLQLASKQRQVMDCLQKIGKLQTKVQKTIGMQTPYRYRNKVSIPIRRTNNGHACGFFAPGSHHLIQVTDCLIAPKEAFVAAWLVCEYLDHHAQEDNNPLGLPLIHQIIYRANQQGHSMVTLVCRERELPDSGTLIHHLKNQLQSLTGVHQTLQMPSDEDSLASRTQTFFGDAHLMEKVDQFSFAVSPLSFFQVNHEISSKMLNFVREQIGTGLTLGDIFCGAGFFSLGLAGQFSQVIGIEANQTAVLDARKNAQYNNIGHATFFDGLAEEVLPGLCQKGMRFDAMVLDPPRKGAHIQVLQAIAMAKPKKLVYISCHPPSQARDAAILDSLGYEVVLAQPFDMFCQTSQVENVLVFRQKTGGETT